MLRDEGAAFIGFVANVSPRGSAELAVAEDPLEQCEPATAAIFESGSFHGHVSGSRL
jgi:hypothetical protein